MRSVVTGLMMLAGSVVREQGQGVDDLVWRRDLQVGAAEERVNDRANERVNEAARPWGGEG